MPWRILRSGLATLAAAETIDPTYNFGHQLFTPRRGLHAFLTRCDRILTNIAARKSSPSRVTGIIDCVVSEACC